MTVHEFPSAARADPQSPKPPTEVLSREVQLLEQCVTYLASWAAYHAAFQIDMGELESVYCPEGPGIKYLRAADKALRSLNRLSPACKLGQGPLSIKELRAKAIVCRAMEKEAPGDLTDDERLYVRLFAQEVEDFLAARADR
jgi:hypothetical protein